MKYFILMADIIESRKKNQTALMENFQSIVNELNTLHKFDILSPLTITLGDEFQGVIKNLSAAIQIILDLEEKTIHRKFDFKLRYILNQGEIETPINKNIAYGMLGNGLTDARLQLNNSKSRNNRFIISIDNKIQNAILTDAFILFENITEKWDLMKDYEMVSNFIMFNDYKLVADKMKKNRSLLWKREKSLNFQSYNSIKRIIQTISS